MESPWIRIGLAAALAASGLIVFCDSNSIIPIDAMTQVSKSSSESECSHVSLPRESELAPVETVSRGELDRMTGNQAGSPTASKLGKGDSDRIASDSWGIYPDKSQRRPTLSSDPARSAIRSIFAQLDHGGNGKLPAAPTITHFGMISDFFFWTVEGPAGAPYYLETSTDLTNWINLGETTTTGLANPPSGFVLTSEVGERYFVRIGTP
jgi:hypothetical protein